MINESHGKIVEFINGYTAGYPYSEVRDIYKLLHQSYHGPEHAVLSRQDALNRIHAEWNNLELDGPETGKPVAEPIFIMGMTPELYRINLKPAKTQGISIDSIYKEFLRTAETFPSEYPSEGIILHSEFIRTLKNLEEQARLGNISLDYYALCGFNRLAEEKSWPAMRHSETFRNAYDPHYRLCSDLSGLIKEC